MPRKSNVIDMDKTFHSTNAVRKYYFPKAYRKEMEEKAIENIGIGRFLANEFLREMKKKINRGK